MSDRSEDLSKVKEYWDTVGKCASEDCKDHWVDGSGNPLPESLYQEVAAYLVEWIDSMPASKSGSQSVLEIGCGTGRILRAIQALRPELALSGIDFSREQIQHARSNVPEANFFVGDLEDFVAASEANQKEIGTYDLIYCHGVIQYFPSLKYFENFLILCFELLKPGAAIYLIDTPIDWYFDQMRGSPRQTVLTPLKELIKKLIGYQSKAPPPPLFATEFLGGKNIEVPIFSGYWAKPEMIQAFSEDRFDEFRFEYQLFKSKPLLYRKYRPNFLLLGKK